MEIRRIVLAVVLMAVVLVLTPVLFPTAVYNTPDGERSADSAAAALAAVDSAMAADRFRISARDTAPPEGELRAKLQPQAQMGAAASAAAGGLDTAVDVAQATEGESPLVPVDTTVIQTEPAIYRTTNQGAALIGAEMRNFRILHDGGRVKGSEVELAVPGDQLLSWRLVVPGDTVRFDGIVFSATDATEGDKRVVRYDATVANRQVSIAYSFLPDSYRVNIDATVSGATENAYLLVDLPPTFRSSEADTVEDRNHLAYAYKVEGSNAKGITFKSLDPGERRIEPGPLTWVAAKNKYFIVGLLAPEGSRGFAELDAVGAVRVSKQATRAEATAVIPVNSGGVRLELYAGPQEYKRLVALGREFETSNPYGGWLQGIVQPFAAATIRLLIWMKATLSISYGWILIIFGIAIRLILWPLNQRFMRSSLQMQRIQPELQEVQKKYKGDPQRMQAELMKVYKAHNASPFSSLSGCLVMLIPFPVFIALFFVFQNTIEFRGVPFLWYPDISVKDPYYITPILVAITSLAMSWMGMRGVKAGDQQKLMMYAMPAVMLFVFINLASGLNLYYLVQNIASLPQQWMIARERRSAAPVTAPSKG